MIRHKLQTSHLERSRCEGVPEAKEIECFGLRLLQRSGLLLAECGMLDVTGFCSGGKHVRDTERLKLCVATFEHPPHVRRQWQRAARGIRLAMRDQEPVAVKLDILPFDSVRFFESQAGLIQEYGDIAEQR